MLWPRSHLPDDRQVWPLTLQMVSKNHFGLLDMLKIKSEQWLAVGLAEGHGMRDLPFPSSPCAVAVHGSSLVGVRPGTRAHANL